MERLAGGKRIMRAADDAAGLGVATNLETRTQSARMALRNIRAAQDIAETADAGSREIVEMLQRMRELAVASASETLDDDERAYLGDEYDELMGEISRTVGATLWDGRPLLSGAQADVMLALTPIGGAIDVATLQSTIVAWQEDMEAEGYSVAFGIAVLGDGAAGDATDSVQLYVDIDGAGLSSALTSLAGATVTNVNMYGAVGQLLGADTFGTDVSAGVDADQLSWRSGAQSRAIVTVQTANPIGGGAFGAFPATINNVNSVSAYAVQEGVDVHRLGASGNGGLAALSGAILYNGTLDGALMTGFLDELADDIRADILPGIGRVQAGPDNVAADRIAFMPTVSLSLAGLGITDTGVDTRSEALTTLSALDDALDVANTFRAQIGSGFNRLDHAYNALEGQTMALDAARSQIEDLDYAEETSEYVRLQILGEASVAAMTQAAQINESAANQLLAAA